VGKIFGFFLLEKIARKLQEKNRGNFWYFFAGKLREIF